MWLSCPFCLVLDVLSLMSSPWCMVLDVRSLMSGPWCLVLDVWSLMSGPCCPVLAVRSLLSGPCSFNWSLFLLPCTCCTALVSHSSTQLGEISSVYPGYAIIVAIGLWNRILKLNQVQILYCGIFIDLLDDVVTGYWWTGSEYLEYISRIRIMHNDMNNRQ